MRRNFPSSSGSKCRKHRRYGTHAIERTICPVSTNKFLLERQRWGPALLRFLTSPITTNISTITNDNTYSTSIEHYADDDPFNFAPQGSQNRVADGFALVSLPVFSWHQNSPRRQLGGLRKQWTDFEWIRSIGRSYGWLLNGFHLHCLLR